MSALPPPTSCDKIGCLSGLYVIIDTQILGERSPIEAARQVITSPLVAIGGINKDNAVDIIGAGANSVAVISAVLAAENIEEASRQILDRVEART